MAFRVRLSRLSSEDNVPPPAMYPTCNLCSSVAQEDISILVQVEQPICCHIAPLLSYLIALIYNKTDFPLVS